MNTNNLKSFFKAFGYAFSGLAACIKTERNMRFHIGAAFYVIILMQFYDLSSGEKALIFLCIGLVIALETINTAVENTVDLCCKENNPKAKIAKDCGAGAVLATAIASATCGITIFWNTKVFRKIAVFFSQKIWLLILLIISVIIWAVWVLSTKSNNDKNQTSNK